MKQFEILTEDDLPYWKKQAAEGKAVVIEIPEQALLDLDLTQYMEEEKSSEVTEKELMEWVRVNSKELKKIADKTHETAMAADALEDELKGTAERPAEADTGGKIVTRGTKEDEDMDDFEEPEDPVDMELTEVLSGAPPEMAEVIMEALDHGSGKEEVLKVVRSTRSAAEAAGRLGLT